MFTDSHCHLDFSCFEHDLDALFRALKKSHINKVVIPATQASSWVNIQKIANTQASAFYALGIHPHFLSSFERKDLNVLNTLLENRDKKCVALGEIGLDKFAPTDIAQQEWLFIEQLTLAQRHQLPIILHCVKMQERVLTILKQQKFQYGGVYHAFSGSLEVANQFIALGFKLGVGGVITYPNSTKTRTTFSQLPLESLLLETDAPDMPLYLQQTRYNTPLNILTIFKSLVNLRNESETQLATQLYDNMHKIFSLSDD